jgi:hypothetical protein
MSDESETRREITLNLKSRFIVASISASDRIGIGAHQKRGQCGCSNSYSTVPRRHYDVPCPRQLEERPVVAENDGLLLKGVTRFHVRASLKRGQSSLKMTDFCLPSSKELRMIA